MFTSRHIKHSRLLLRHEARADDRHEEREEAEPHAGLEHAGATVTEGVGLQARPELHGVSAGRVLGVSALRLKRTQAHAARLIPKLCPVLLAHIVVDFDPTRIEGVLSVLART